MRNKIAIISIILFTFVNLGLKAQVSVTSSGISLQGIARDENNSALANLTQLELVFSLYWLNSSSVEQTILNRTANVTTDNFGVFSYVFVIDQLQYNLISTKEAYLKVVQGSTVFSNEKLQSVPYAVHAQNGVPTGSIMPFIGAAAPNGWLLCNGSTISNNAYTLNLRLLLGGTDIGITNTPNLNGLFLRGTGAAATGETGPALKAIQQDGVIAHAHNVNLNTNTTGNHTHNYTTRAGLQNNIDGGGGRNDMYQGDGNYNTGAAGNHNHNVSGNTANNGAETETRPINYGVNYIIKI